MLELHARRCMAKRSVMEESGPANAEPASMRAQISAVKIVGCMMALCRRISTAREDRDLQDSLNLPLMFRYREVVKDCARC